MAAAAVVAGSALTKAFAKWKIMPQEVDAIEPNAVAGVPGLDLETKTPKFIGSRELVSVLRGGKNYLS